MIETHLLTFRSTAHYNSSNVHVLVFLDGLASISHAWMVGMEL